MTEQISRRSDGLEEREQIFDCERRIVGR